MYYLSLTISVIIAVLFFITLNRNPTTLIQLPDWGYRQWLTFIIITLVWPLGLTLILYYIWETRQ